MSREMEIVGALPSAQEFQTIKELGAMAVKSGFMPIGIKTAEQAVIIMLKGRELGIPPMQAFSSIAVINGKPALSAELMVSLIYKNIPGAIINFVHTDAKKCEIEARRPGGKSTRFVFTLEDAQRANLVSKGVWTSYPAAMLRARCLSAMARAMFPDALAGAVYTPEEMGAEVDEKGTIIHAPREVDPISSEPAEAIPVTEPIALPVDPKPFSRCCSAPLTMSRDGKKYYCPNWQDTSVEHTIFPTSGLKTYLEHRAAELAEEVREP